MVYHIGDEEVNGTIVGGDTIAWKLFYDGKPLMFSMAFADTEEEIMRSAKAMKARIQQENKITGRYQEDKFDVRIY